MRVGQVCGGRKKKRMDEIKFGKIILKIRNEN